MDFIENKQNWKTGESSFWEFIILLWITISILLTIVIFSFRLYLLPKFKEYKIKHPQTNTKILKDTKRVNTVKEKTFKPIKNTSKNLINFHYESTSQTGIDKNDKYKLTKEERKIERLKQKQLKQQEKIEKKELKAEIKRIKQEKKLQQKLEKQKLKKDKKIFTKVENNENSIEKNDIENSSQIEEEEKGE